MANHIVSYVFIMIIWSSRTNPVKLGYIEIESKINLTKSPTLEGFRPNAQMVRLKAQNPRLRG